MLQLLTWTATGLIIGWLVRTVMRSRREYGLLGDLVTGWLGAFVGGWLFRRLDVVAPDNLAGHVVTAVVGAAALMVSVRVLRQAMSVATVANVANVVPVVDLEERIRKLGALERNIVSGLLTRQLWARDPNKAFDAQSTFGERLADRVALFGGSWTFIGLFAIVLVGWMAVNQDTANAYDPFPFILLNLGLSTLAALQGPIIMMSQNRQSARDRSDAKTDYEVNVRAEMEIMALHTKVDLLREQEWLRLTTLLEEQQQMLVSLQSQLDGMGRRGQSS